MRGGAERLTEYPLYVRVRRVVHIRRAPTVAHPNRVRSYCGAVSNKTSKPIRTYAYPPAEYPLCKACLARLS